MNSKTQHIMLPYYIKILNMFSAALDIEKRDENFKFDQGAV